MALKKCPRCGENFADSYKTCPFCAEDDEYYNGKLKKRNRRQAKKRAPSIWGPVVIVIIILVLALAVWLFFGDQISSRVSGWLSPEVVTPSGPENPPSPAQPSGSEPTVVDDISLDVSVLTLSVGERRQMTVTGGDGKYTWSAGTPTVAAVTESGLVTAIAKGTCIITVTGKNDASASCTVTVTDQPEPPTPQEHEPVDLSKVKILSGGAELPKSSEEDYTYDVVIKEKSSMKLEVTGTDVTPEWDWDEGGTVVTVKNNIATADQGKPGRYSTLRCILGDKTIKIKFHSEN